MKATRTRVAVFGLGILLAAGGGGIVLAGLKVREFSADRATEVRLDEPLVFEFRGRV